MKYRISIFGAVIMSLLAAASCTKENKQDEEKPEPNLRYETVSVGMAPSKVSFNEESGAFSWQAGDKILVQRSGVEGELDPLAYEAEVSSTSSGAKVVVGLREYPAESGQYEHRAGLAYYPSNIVAANAVIGATAIDLPTVYDDYQYPYAPTPMIAVQTSGDLILDNLAFRHIGGAVLLTLSLDEVTSTSVKSVVIKTNAPCTGTFTASVVDGRYQISSNDVTEQGYEVTYNFASAILPGETKKLILPLPLGNFTISRVCAYGEDDRMVAINLDGSSTISIDKPTRGRKVSMDIAPYLVNQSNFTTFESSISGGVYPADTPVYLAESCGVAKSEVQAISGYSGKVTTAKHLSYYVKNDADGTKNGLSWENAWSVSQFKSFVGKKDGASDAYDQLWEVNGVTFRFGKGTFVFGDATADRLTIDFQAASGSDYAEFNIVGDDPDGNPTIFSGDNTYGILNVFDRARVHITNVTFANAMNTASTADNTDPDGVNLGAALYIKAHDYTSVKACPRVWLTNCVFDGNVTDHSSSTHVFEGGSAINIVHGAVYADHCIFTNNVNKRNGPVKMSGKNLYATSPAYAFLNACLFTGNVTTQATSGQGSVIIRQMRKGGLLGLYNCTFYNNFNLTTSADSKKRFCITLDRSAIIANCTIVDEFDDGAPVRINADSKVDRGGQYFLINNILMNVNGTNAFYSISYNRGSSPDVTMNLYKYAGNLYGAQNNSYKNTNVTSPQYNNHAYSEMGSPSFDSTNNVFTWDGTLSGGEHPATCRTMSLSHMTTALCDPNINEEASPGFFSVTGSDGPETYAGFYTWLNSIGALSKDATGYDRGSSNWTPGAYQAR